MIYLLTTTFFVHVGTLRYFIRQNLLFQRGVYIFITGICVFLTQHVARRIVILDFFGKAY